MANRTMVVTTNYRPSALVERGYERIVSRLAEAATRVDLQASDFRVEIAARRRAASER